MSGNTTASSTSLPAPPAAVIGLDPNKLVPIQITLPSIPGIMNSEARVLTITVPASALQENQLHQVITGPIITSIMPLPPQIASSVLQQHVNSQLQNVSLSKCDYPFTLEFSLTRLFCLDRISVQKQMDGAADTSDEEDGSDISDDHLDNDDDNLEKSDEENLEGAEEEPLNSEDDVTDEESSELFETDNVVVCQYDKVCLLLPFFYHLPQTHLFKPSPDHKVSQQMEILLKRRHYECQWKGFRISKVKWRR